MACWAVVPGVYYVPNSQVKINGAQTNSYAFHVEGQDSTNAGFPYAAAQTQPSVDAIQEVSIQTSNFAAEYGAVGGGFFNVTIKSGTNQFRGTVYDYFVNEILNAGTPFTNAGLTDSTKDGNLIRQRARRNDYGFTIGGPVIIPKLYNGKDKTFFFFNFEQFRETQIINNTPITVPTNNYRNGNFSGVIAADGNKQIGTDIQGNPLLAGEIFDPTTRRTVTVNGQNYVVESPFNNNSITMSAMDPVALKVQNLIPAATNGNAINNLLPTYDAVRQTTIPALKVDQLIGSKQKISFYWSKTRTTAPLSPIYGNSEGLPSPITESRGSYIGGPVERLNYDYTVTPTMLVHLGVGYQQNDFFDNAPVLDYNAAATLGLTGATINRNFPIFNGFCSPTIACTAAGGTYNMGPSRADPQLLGKAIHQRQHNLGSGQSYRQGRHGHVLVGCSADSVHQHQRRLYVQCERNSYAISGGADSAGRIARVPLRQLPSGRRGYIQHRGSRGLPEFEKAARFLSAGFVEDQP